MPTEATPISTLFTQCEMFDLPHFGGRDHRKWGLYPWNLNPAKIFVQWTYAQDSSAYVLSFGSYRVQCSQPQTNPYTNKHPLVYTGWELFTATQVRILTKRDDTDRDVWWCQVQGRNASPTSEIQVDQVQKCQSPRIAQSDWVSNI